MCAPCACVDVCVCVCVCECGLTRWWNVNPCDRIILWGVPRCHLFNSMHCSSITAWNGPPKLCILHTNSHTHTRNKKKPLSYSLWIHLFFIVSCTFTHCSHRAYISPSPPFCFVLSPSNPVIRRTEKSEKRKFPNKSPWHREHLFAQCVYSSFCVRSKSRWRLQYVPSLLTFLIVCETNCRDKWSTLPLETSH